MNPTTTHPSAGADPGACLELLRGWSAYAESYWYPIPGHPDLGCFGTGYDHNWGIQTNLKYVGAMAALGVLGPRLGVLPEGDAARAVARALAALRYDLRTHLSGDLVRMDGGSWGHGWITGLGIERAMFGVYLLDAHLADGDRAALRRVLCSEADWLLDEYEVVGDVWGHSGRNRPESNMWNGALLWRAAVSYPDHPHAGRWRERAHRFLVNAISVPADAADDRPVAGRPIREWHVGANYFPHYSLDHHAYTNVGYSVVTLSNAAMLHYDLSCLGLEAPESLYHHNADLWAVVRRTVFADGRLARIGGDSRVRYAYCQEYLLPVLIYAADHLGDREAGALIGAQVELIRGEYDWSGDGSFYGRRLAPLAHANPYYHSRLESDRAAVLGMAATYLVHLTDSGRPLSGAADAAGRDAFERSVAGGWCEPEHGAALHRSPTRLAAYAWRAHGLTQGTCQPPDNGHLAEWHQNLTGVVRFLGDDGVIRGGQTTHRRLERQRIEPFDGGFLTYGAVTEGLDLAIDEGWRGEQPALHQVVFAALPDGHTVIGLEHCRTLGNRCYVVELKGLHLNVPNDLYNACRRELTTAQGNLVLESPPDREEVLGLGSAWANVDGRVGAVGLYGAEKLAVHRTPWRRGGRYHSLHVEELCWPCAVTGGAHPVDPHTTLLDVGWAVLSSVTAEETGAFARSTAAFCGDGEHPDVRWVRVAGRDGRAYAVVANVGPRAVAYPLAPLLGAHRRATDLAGGETCADQGDVPLRLEAGQGRVLVLE